MKRSNTELPERLRRVGAVSRIARRGGALLAVLWLSAALAAIAFSAAQTVRAERERTRNQLDGTQADLLAASAVERGLYYVLGAPISTLPDGTPVNWIPAMPYIRMNFPSGEALVEMIPESSKIGVNTAPPELLARLIIAMGVAPAAAIQMSAAIDYARTPLVGGPESGDFIQQAGQTFRVPHASFEQIEELLTVSGITPELFYGRVERTPDGGWTARSGLRDCLTVYSGQAAHDINSVQPAVMLAEGVDPASVKSIVALRKQRPITPEQLGDLRPALGDMAGQFQLGGGKVLMLRATARVRGADGRLGELRRTSTLTVLLAPNFDPRGYRVLNARSGPAERPLEETWAW